MTSKTNLIFKEIDESLDTVNRHLKIVKTLLKEQPAGIIRISRLTGLAEHKIRYSLRILEKEGVIIPSKEGAILSPEFIGDKEHLIDEAEKLVSKCQMLYEEIKLSFEDRK